MPPSESSLLIRIFRRRRNQYILLAMVLLGVTVRIALPNALRPWIVSQVDAALVGRIALDDLDLSLIRGSVTLHGLAVFSDELPPPAPEAEPEAEVKPPLFEAKRLAVEISWLALLAKTLRIENFELEHFAVRLDRKAEGLVLPQPVPGEAPPEPETNEPLEWSFIADFVALRDGEIRLDDFTVDGEPRRFEREVTEILAHRFALLIDPAGDEPARLELDAQIGESVLRGESEIEFRVGGPAALSRIAIESLPIGDVRLFLDMVGWRDLAGSLDATIEHRFETDGANELAGSVTLSNVVVSVPKQDRPALAWEKLGIDFEKVDLAGQIVTVSNVALEGGRLLVDLKAEETLPLLAPPPGPRPQASEDAAGKPWTWSVAKARVDGASIDLLGAAKPLPVRLHGELRSLGSKPGARSPLTLSLDPGDGSLAFDGALGVFPFSLDGKLKIEDLELPPVLARFDAPGLALLREGTAQADLQVKLAPRGAAAGDSQPLDLRLGGTLGLAGIDVGEEKTAKDFAVAWKDAEVEIREIAVPGLIGATDPGKPLEIAVDLGRVRLENPAFILTRTPEGILLPSLESDADAREDDTSPAPQIRVSIAQAEIEGGKAKIADRTTQPFYRTRIDPLEMKARGIRWPDLVVDDLVLAMQGMEGAKLDASGSIGKGDSKLRVKLVEVPLAPFNPYLKDSGYSLGGGTLTLDSKAKIGSGSYDTSSKIVFSKLDVGGAEGDSLFQETFGIPLSLALGLLKDLNGNIKLSVPVASDQGGARVGFTSVVAQALRKALFGALASPLKLFGAVLADGKVKDLAPEPIAFAPGLAEITEEGGARLEQIANQLAASPGIALTLRGETAPEDARWLKEEALLEELRATSGVRAITQLGEIGTRTAVREHLEAGRAGRETALQPAEQAWLEAQVAERTVDPVQLAALADARAVAAQQLLVSEYGIKPVRLSLGPPVSEAPSPSPGVLFVLGVLPKDSP